MNALVVNCSPVRTGATAEIVRIAAEWLSASFHTETLCIDDYHFRFCTGCRSCHQTAQCILEDDIPLIVSRMEWADVILLVSPSYWADIPGQFKAFIDRCTPWCNTHEPHLALSSGKIGFAIALRTGSSMKECDRIIQSIEHYYGHMEIQCCGHIGLCSVENREDALSRKQEIEAFCEHISATCSE